MIGFGDLEKDFCLKTTNYLFNHPLAKAFLYPVSKDADYAEDYYKIISIPMDLYTVISNIQNNQYKSFGEWQNDIKQIWVNGKTFNKEKSIIYISADILDRKSEKLFKSFCRTEQERIERNIKMINNKISELLSLDMPEYSISPRLNIEELKEKFGC